MYWVMMYLTQVSVPIPPVGRAIKSILSRYIVFYEKTPTKSVGVESQSDNYVSPTEGRYTLISPRMACDCSMPTHLTIGHAILVDGSPEVSRQTVCGPTRWCVVPTGQSIMYGLRATRTVLGWLRWSQGCRWCAVSVSGYLATIGPCDHRHLYWGWLLPTTTRMVSPPLLFPLTLNPWDHAHNTLCYWHYPSYTIYYIYY